MDTTFAHFGTGGCAGKSVAIGLNPTEKDYSPDTWLTNINWHDVWYTNRMRLGDVSLQPAECADGQCHPRHRPMSPQCLHTRYCFLGNL